MKVIIYANGFVTCSVCAPKGMSKEEVENEVNKINPTGIKSRWSISKEKFRNGETNPCECDKDSKKLHYLMNC